MRPILTTLILALFFCISSAAAQETVDAFVAEVERTVESGDFQGYASLYHEEAVLVHARSGTAVPIESPLARWKSGFEDTRAGRRRVELETRVTRRIVGEAVAHLTGVYAYTLQLEGGEPSIEYVHFQDLLLREGGQWKWMMEYAVGPATAEEFAAAAAGEEPGRAGG